MAKPNFKIGNGYDVHKLVEGRDLMIGGVKIPHSKGLLGHSDADVLIHAIMDAILGAAALPDIGNIFPDNDGTYKNADSIKLLEEVVQLVQNKGYKISNIDSIIIAQAPKMKPHLLQMGKIIGEACKIDPQDVNVKATTEEGLGFTGSGEGIAAHAVCLLYKE